MNIIKTILVGTGATAAIDCFTYTINFFGQGHKPRGILFVGRWLTYFTNGKFFHHTIIETPSIANELIIGRIAHYSIGIIFAFLLVLIYGVKWLVKPKLFPAIVIALVTLITPIFVLQPALGFGIAFSNMPQQVSLIIKTLLIHLVYGVGLYLSAKFIQIGSNVLLQIKKNN